MVPFLGKFSSCNFHLCFEVKVFSQVSKQLLKILGFPQQVAGRTLQLVHLLGLQSE
jgi:hypothetical protein